MPDLGASAVRTLGSSIHVATTITKLSREVLLAVLKVIRDQMNTGQISLKRLNRSAVKNGATMTSVSLPDKEAQAIIDDLEKSGVTFAVKREGEGIRIFFYAQSTEIIKAAIDDALKKHSKEQEQPKKEGKAAENDTPTQENPTPEQSEQETPPPEQEQTKQAEQPPPEQEQPEPEAQPAPEQKQTEQPPPHQEQEKEPPPEPPPKEEQKQERVPLYRQSSTYATEHGEREAYRISMMENIACKEAIERVIAEGYDGQRLPDAISHDIIDRFGVERVGFVLAASVVQGAHDLYFSLKNREWAKQEAPDLEPNASRYRVNVHPGVLNVFINDAREYFAQVKQHVLSVAETATAFADHAKIVREGEEVPTPDEPPKEEERAGETQASSKPEREEKAKQKEQGAEPEPEFASFEDLLNEGVKLSQEHNARHAGQQRPTPDRKREQTR